MADNDSTHLGKLDNVRLVGKRKINALVDRVTAVEASTGLANAVAGVAAGYKIARGTVTPTSASHTVVTGLATVVAAFVTFKGALSLTHMFNAADIGDQAGTPAAGSFLLISKKPTANNDVTPIASTTPWAACEWLAIGT